MSDDLVEAAQDDYIRRSLAPSSPVESGVVTGPVEGTKSAAELLREVIARDPEAHRSALARGYGVGPVEGQDELLDAVARAIATDSGFPDWDGFLEGSRQAFRHRASVALAVAEPLIAARVRAEAAEHYAHADNADLTDAFRQLAEMRAQLDETVRAEAVAESLHGLTPEQMREQTALSNEIIGELVLEERIAEAVAEERQQIEARLRAAVDATDAAVQVWNLIDELAAGSVPAAIPTEPADDFETRIEYGHQTAEVGWIPEHRGIKYASHQREVRFRLGEPVVLDHWSDSDGRRLPVTETVSTSEQDGQQ